MRSDNVALAIFLPTPRGGPRARLDASGLPSRTATLTLGGKGGSGTNTRAEGCRHEIHLRYFFHARYQYTGNKVPTCLAACGLVLRSCARCALTEDICRRIDKRRACSRKTSPANFGMLLVVFTRCLRGMRGTTSTFLLGTRNS